MVSLDLLADGPFDSLVIDARVWLNEAIKEVPAGDKVEGVRLLLDAVWKF
jgi:hypothetical protein